MVLDPNFAKNPLSFKGGSALVTGMSPNLVAYNREIVNQEEQRFHTMESSKGWSLNK